MSGLRAAGGVGKRTAKKVAKGFSGDWRVAGGLGWSGKPQRLSLTSRGPQQRSPLHTVAHHVLSIQASSSTSPKASTS